MDGTVFVLLDRRLVVVLLPFGVTRLYSDVVVVAFGMESLASFFRSRVAVAVDCGFVSLFMVCPGGVPIIDGL